MAYFVSTGSSVTRNFRILVENARLFYRHPSKVQQNQSCSSGTRRAAHGRCEVMRALDRFRDLAGVVVAGGGELIHSGRLCPFAARGGHRVADR